MQAEHYSSQRLMMRPFKQTDSDALTLGLQEPLVSCQLANVPDDYQPQHASNLSPHLARRIAKTLLWLSV